MRQLKAILVLIRISTELSVRMFFVEYETLVN
jgi:hypothetical protein